MKAPAHHNQQHQVWHKPQDGKQRKDRGLDDGSHYEQRDADGEAYGARSSRSARLWRIFILFQHNRLKIGNYQDNFQPIKIHSRPHFGLLKELGG